MKFLRNMLDKLHPLFDKGGKLERLYPLYEAGDTFLFTPGHVAKGLTHIRDAIDLKRMMTMVVIALIPCVLMAFWNTGYQANLAIAHIDRCRARASLRLASIDCMPCWVWGTIRAVSLTILSMVRFTSCRSTSSA